MSISCRNSEFQGSFSETKVNHRHFVVVVGVTCGSDSSPSASLKSSSAPNLRMAVSSSLLKGLELQHRSRWFALDQYYH